MELRFLGTGPSLPIPRLGCRCITCREARRYGSKTKRTRSSALLKVDRRHLLIDASPDVLVQLERVKIRTVDAVLLTHAHADASGGLNDLDNLLRAARHQATLLVESGTLRHIIEFYGKPSRWMEIKKLKSGTSIEFFGRPIRPFRVLHSMTGRFPTLGYRIGPNFVYASDVRQVPRDSEKYLAGVRHFVLDGCMWFGKQIKSHLTVDRAIQLAARLKIKNLYLTQISHTYPPHPEAVRAIRAYCRKQKITLPVTLAYDGLKINVRA